MKPRKPRRGKTPKTYWVDSPKLRTELYAYKQDVAVSASCIPEWSATGVGAIVGIDAEINDAGVLIDAPLAQAASGVAERALADLNASIAQKTCGAVPAASQVVKLKEWLKAQGVELPRKLHRGQAGSRWQNSLDGDDIEKLITGTRCARCA